MPLTDAGVTPQGPGALPGAPAAPGVPGAQPATEAATTSQAALQSQIGQYQAQLAGLRAQRAGLKEQLDQMLRSNPARPGVQQQWADVGVQMAQMEGKIAVLQAQYAIQTGHALVPPSLPPIPRQGIDATLVLGMGFVLLLAIVVPFTFGAARRLWRSSPQTGPRQDEITPRLDRLEHAVDAIAIEVERISEGQRFMTKIMAERAQPAAPNGSTPPLALGAGAAEPVRVGERDGEKIGTPRG